MWNKIFYLSFTDKYKSVINSVVVLVSYRQVSKFSKLLLSLIDVSVWSTCQQEELMYTDAAVDESSFQVLLLSGEELG